MASSLKSRLARLKELGLTPASGLSRPEPDGTASALPVIDEAPLPQRGVSGQSRLTRALAPRRAEPSVASLRERPRFLDRWEELAPFVYRREYRRTNPLPPELDPAPFCSSLSRRRRSGADPEFPGAVETAALRFFDLETTGLSGGSGTIAFLAAIGRTEGSDFLVEQFFLADYPGEKAFVEAILAALGEGTMLVTYNGRAFDLPLLRVRCVMCGLDPPKQQLHLDVLHIARRLWRSVWGGASLGLLEQAVLGLEREGDVPGALVPQVYFEYLAAGDSPLMPGVLSHNADDVFGLARLTARAAALLEEPLRRAEAGQVDLGRLGRLLLFLGRIEEADGILELAAGEGDLDSGLFLARLRRREGCATAALAALALLPESFESLVERARVFERILGDLDASLLAAKAARALAGSHQVDAAERRIARLARRIASRGA